MNIDLLGVIYELHITKNPMQRSRSKAIKHYQRQEIMAILIYRGESAAIRQYRYYTGCKLKEARQAVTRIAWDIEPGPAR